MDPSPTSVSPATPSSWRTARRLLLAVAIVATLVAVFYTVENWRGQRAWENCRRALEAKGVVLDWTAYIPAPVPDEQNFYKAPHMQDWFVREHFSINGPEPTNGPKPFVTAPHKGTNLVLAEVTVVAPNAPLDIKHTGPVLRFADSSAPSQAAELLNKTLGSCAIGARNCAFVGQSVQQFSPAHLVLEADHPVPSAPQLTTFFAGNPQTQVAYPYLSHVQVERAGSDTFRLSFKEPVYGAADYLAWTEPLAPEFDLLRQALQRPYARIDCDYQQPFGIAIPNFIRIRDVVQILSQRAQCYLLLGQPEAAWHELSLVHDVCQILGPKPPGQPETLVGAMINVAVIGLYAGIVEDGLRLHAWQEPQLRAIEAQLKETDLLTITVKAFKEERAATCRTFETMPRRELIKLMNSGQPVFKLGLALMPQGWFYQNMVAGSSLEQEWLEGSVDLTNRVVRARHISEVVQSLSSGHHSPYNWLVAVALPNFGKAMQTTVHNQTLVNEAELACALERYRLAQGSYPDTLGALTPQFLDKLPHDLIGGQPLKYRRTEGKGYQLYSVGWNEKDDGGQAGKSREDGDWVWELR
jgi:hypothetical protein